MGKQRLREDQERTLDAIREAMRTHRRIAVQVPTGGGKTTIAAVAAEAAVDKGMRVWFSAHRAEIIQQGVRRFRDRGLKVGVFHAGSTDEKPDFSLPVQAVSMQTLVARFDKRELPPPPDVWFIDECHHLPAETWMRVFEYAGNKWVIGLSATPYRADGNGLGDGFECVVIGPSPKELVASKVLVAPEIFCSSSEVDGIHGDVVEEWLKRCTGRRTVVFAKDIEHSTGLLKSFREKGVSALHVDGTTCTADRLHAIKSLETGDVSVLLNVGIFTEGFDLPDISAIVLARSIMSESLYVQMVGRGLRGAPGKQDCIINDHGGNAARWGSPLAERPADLSGRKKNREKEQQDGCVHDLRVCDICLRPFQANKTMCEHCGAAQKKRKLKEHREIRLHKFDGVTGTNVRDRLSFFRRINETRGSMSFFTTMQCYRAKYGVPPHDDKELFRVLPQADRARYWNNVRNANKKRNANGKT